MDAEIFHVLVGSVIVAGFARWRHWPAPLVVTVVAIAVAGLSSLVTLLTGTELLPSMEIDGHFLLSLVLPPLLYSAALDVSFVGFRRSLPQIRRLGIWLVLVTAVAVGLVAYWLFPTLGLPGALLLGAIVSPPDAVSAAAIGRKLGLPRRVMTVLSGESLINDATSLTLYRVFAAIVAGTAITVWDGVWQFVLAVVLGVAIGLLFGAVLHQLRMRLSDVVVVGTFGLLVPFGAYAIAEHLGGSGVLAVVTMGFFVGFNSPRTDYTTRQQETPLWLSMDFLLESFVFAYIGLQFPRVLSDLGTESAEQMLLLAGVILVVVLLVRPAFIYPMNAWARMRERQRLRRLDATVASGRFDRIQKKRHPRRDPATPEEVRDRIREPHLSWKDNAIISWAGMRGVVTLATALAAADIAALPAEPSRAIVVVAFVVTVGTLLLQGLTLPLLIRSLHIEGEIDKKKDAQDLATVRARTKEAGTAYLAARRRDWEAKYGEGHLKVFDVYTKRMTKNTQRVTEIVTDAGAPQTAGATVEGPSYDDLVSLMKGWLHVRRETLLAERDAGNIDEELMRELIAAMDAEELALDARSATRPLDRA